MTDRVPAPLPIRDAATVVLLRSPRGGADGVEVFLMRRVATMAFGAGKWVFPGGALDADDHELVPPALTVGWGDRLGTDEVTARGLLGAGLREVQEEAGITLDPSEIALMPWARYITPEGMSRRFDARFFVADLPEHLEPRVNNLESDDADWFTPETALELPMMGPTRVIVRELADFDSPAAVFAAAADRVIEPIAG